MATRADINKGNQKRVLGVRYPADRAELLDAIRIRRGDRFLSETIARALDRYIEDELGLDLAA